MNQGAEHRDPAATAATAVNSSQQQPTAARAPQQHRHSLYRDAEPSSEHVETRTGGKIAVTLAWPPT